MFYKPDQQSHENQNDSIPFIMEGQVVSISDPDQMGRCKIWIPGLDGENVNVEDLPWARYATPFFGFTVEYPNGGIPTENPSHSAYGWWAIPKIGASVFVFFVNANPGARCYFASTPQLHRNRSLPNGRNKDIDNEPGPWGDAGDGEGKFEPIQPAYDNIRQQFQDDVENSIAITRGAQERQVAQGKNDKDGEDGYSNNPIDDKNLEPQTYCMITPGRHGFIMQDDPKRSKLRIKTAEGHQIIFDDSNERIYVSTAKGKSWFEMDLDGHIHMFSAQSISFRAGLDMNFFADRNIHFEAHENFHIKANTGEIRLNATKSIHVNTMEKFELSACDNIDISTEAEIRMQAEASIDVFTKSTFSATAKTGINLFTGLKIKASAMTGIDLLTMLQLKMEGKTGVYLKTNIDMALTAGDGIDIHGGSHIKETAGVIHLNGPTAKKAPSAAYAAIAKEADCPELAEAPVIVPGHEPWERPPSPNERGPNWQA